MEFNPTNQSLCLQQICESNYQKLFKLIPNLLNVRTTAIGVSPRYSQLQLTVLEQSAYTLTVELTHCFSKNPALKGIPQVIIRLYLDACLAEVLSDHVRDNVSKVFQDPALSYEIMHYKWRLNYFLQKWLDHCLDKNYQFSIATDVCLATF